MKFSQIIIRQSHEYIHHLNVKFLFSKQYNYQKCSGSRRHILRDGILIYAYKFELNANFQTNHMIECP